MADSTPRKPSKTLFVQTMRRLDEHIDAQRFVLKALTKKRHQIERDEQTARLTIAALRRRREVELDMAAPDRDRGD